MKFIRIQCSGYLNSFRQPDFHTYHKTLPLPPKTTVAGMIGSALGISPESVNDEWLINNRFQMGIVGKSKGKANDLWQIRKYEDKQIKAYFKGNEALPYKTAVIVRELLYASEFVLYLTFKNETDFSLVLKMLNNPSWALSLGREDELVNIHSIEIINLEEKENLSYFNTIIPFDLFSSKYSIDFNARNSFSTNLLEEAPSTVKLPISFIYNKQTNTREANEYKIFSFINNLPIRLDSGSGFMDEEFSCSFQVF